MSILIKDMEMPRSCNECPFSVDGYCTVVKYPNGDAMNRHYKPLWCPLIEIPPHGDLIDRDALMSDLKFLDDDADYYTDAQIRFAPTVIEEEGRE